MLHNISHILSPITKPGHFFCLYDLILIAKRFSSFRSNDNQSKS